MNKELELYNGLRGKMKNVRKDVRIKLMEGLIREQNRAIKWGTTPPKMWHYDTPKAKHYIYVNYEKHEIYFNTIGYDGTRYFTKDII